MLYVRQKGDHDCAIAVAAMLAGVNYAQAAKVAPPAVLKNGTWHYQLVDMLAQLTGLSWRAKSRNQT